MKTKEYVSANFKIVEVSDMLGGVNAREMLDLLEQQRAIQTDYDLAGVDVPGDKFFFLIYRKQTLPESA